MSKRPSFQFYPADWRKDAELQSCSLTARGLWHEMLCIMHECEPYGYLVVNGNPMSAAQLARLVGIPTKQCSILLEELIGAGVPSTDEQGRIYSRRMVRDEKERDGWRDRQGKHRKRHTNVTADVTHESPVSSSSTSSPVVPSSEAKASSDGADAQTAVLKKQVWEEAKALGIAKGAIGEMFKLCGQDTAALHALIRRCAENHKVGRAENPTSWCMAELHPRKTGPPNGSGKAVSADEDRRKALENLNKFMSGQ